MQITEEQLSPGKYRLTITVPPEIYESHLRDTAFELGAKMSIPGFRPGKVPYNILKARIGEMKLISKSIEQIVSHNYFAALKEKKLRSVAQPKINVTKLAPNNNIEFTAEFLTLPKVSLADFSKIELKSRKLVVTDKDVETTLQELQKMRATEVLKESAITDGDKVEFDIESRVVGDENLKDTAKNQTIVIGETPLIIGFADNLKGLKSGETKTFTLKFPKNYHKKEYAENEVELTVHISKIWERKIPEADDEFARLLNKRFANLAELKNELRKNISLEREYKEKERLKREAIEKARDMSTYEEIGQETLELVTNGLFEDVKKQLATDGSSMEDYLKSINKTEGELKKEFAREAVLKTKLDALIAEVIDYAKITVDDKDIDMEVNEVLRRYKSISQARRDINIQRLTENVHHNLLYQKAVEHIRNQVMVGK